MCLDTCLAIANVIFLLRTHQLPWALENYYSAMHGMVHRAVAENKEK